MPSRIDAWLACAMIALASSCRRSPDMIGDHKASADPPSLVLATPAPDLGAWRYGSTNDGPKVHTAQRRPRHPKQEARRRAPRGGAIALPPG
jgi:hypothetical protein